ncbi:MAG: metallophosphoesterase [Clostridiales bacterium]|nr:metallophosphoesterase [Clostridiales bacterium]
MIYSLSDLHLSFGTNKPMNVFGRNWDGYEEKIKKNWNNIVKRDDYVLVCGDVSWAMYIDDAALDFSYINELNGTKIISKGNHDYWWCTHNKQKNFIEKHGFERICFLHNNSYMAEGVGICGARGWLAGELCNSDEDKKIYDRELQRLELSIKSIPAEAERKIAMLHYPPDLTFMKMLSDYKIDDCVYGHLHAGAHKNAIYGCLDGVRYNLTSCDYLGFKPLLIKGE